MASLFRSGRRIWRGHLYVHSHSLYNTKTDLRFELLGLVGSVDVLLLVPLDDGDYSGSIESSGIDASVFAPIHFFSVSFALTLGPRRCDGKNRCYNLRNEQEKQ